MLFLFSVLAAVISTGVIEKTINYRKLQKKLAEQERIREMKRGLQDLNKKIREQKEAKRQAYREERDRLRNIKELKRSLRVLNKRIRFQKQAAKEAYLIRTQAQREEAERRKNIIKLPPPKKLTKAHLARVFENMDEQNMKICRNIVSRAVTNPHNPRAREFDAFKREINVVIDKNANKKHMSGTDKSFLKAAERLFIPESGWTKYKPIRSSWLLKVAYNKPKQQLVVHMKRGSARYTFYKVPGWVYVALIVKTNRAGKMWWDKWFWRYSNNPKWKGVKKQWQNKS